MSICWHTCAVVRRSVQIDSTAVIFCCGSNTLRIRWLVFIVYILSCVIHKFFFPAGVGSVHQHLYLAFFGSDYHRLAAHPADHVKRIHRTAPKRQLQGVFLHALLQRLLQIVGDLEKSVGRTQPTDTLMRPLVVVVLHPHGLLEAVKLDTLQEFVEDRLPEPFDLSKRHGMMRPGADVLDPVFFHLPLKPGLIPPVRILPAVVGEHLPGHAVFGNCAPVGFQNVFGRLAAVQTKGRDVPAVVVHEADQVGVAACQPEGHDVALPQLVRSGALEKPRLGSVFRRFALGLSYHTLCGQGLVDGRRTGADQKKPLEHVGDPARPVVRMILLDLHHPLPDFGRYPGPAGRGSLRLQPLGPVSSVGSDPAPDRMTADTELLSKQARAAALLEEKPYHPQPEFSRIDVNLTRALGTGRTVLLSLFHGLHSSLCNWFLHSAVLPLFLRFAVS